MSEAGGRCATCRHWRFEAWRYQPTGPTPLADAMSTCARMDHNGDYPEDDRSLAWAFVGGEDAVVFTKPTFGCVMWEAKGQPVSEQGPAMTDRILFAITGEDVRAGDACEFGHLDGKVRRAHPGHPWFGPAVCDIPAETEVVIWPHGVKPTTTQGQR